MATRSLFIFNARDHMASKISLCFYKHYDGYEGYCVPMIVKAFKSAARRGNCLTFTAFMTALLAQDPNFEISTDAHGDLEYRYEFRESAGGEIFLTVKKRRFTSGGQAEFLPTRFNNTEIGAFATYAEANKALWDFWPHFMAGEDAEAA